MPRDKHLSKHSPLPFRQLKPYSCLASRILISIICAIAYQATPSQALAKSAFLAKKSMLEGQARDLQLIQKSLDENNSQLRGQTQTLASVLPKFISRRAALNGRDFNLASALISRLNQYVGINPYETNPRLLQELQLKRFELGIPASQVQLTQAQPQAISATSIANSTTTLTPTSTSAPASSVTTTASNTGVPRFSFQQVSYLLPGDPLKQGALAPILKERHFPGTFRILIDGDARFLIYAIDITGQPLRIENSTVYQEGQFN
jgi:hypothetical protein